MNLPKSAKQDRLGEAYVRAIAAKAGCTALATESGADFGTDLTINNIALNPHGKPEEDGALIKVQLKSVFAAEVKGDHLVYALDVKDYNRLVRQRLTSRILVVFHLPHKEDDWLQVTRDATTIRNCAYWLIISPGAEESKNSSNVTVKIPISQVFDPTALQELMARVLDGQIL